MSVASDFFIAEFGDRFLEFELSVDRAPVQSVNGEVLDAIYRRWEV